MHLRPPYQHDKNNSDSYFVELSNGETKWGVNLKEVIEGSGAQIGDEVTVSKSGSKEVQIVSQKLDENGHKLPPETINATCNDWIVEVVQPKAQKADSVTTDEANTQQALDSSNFSLVDAVAKVQSDNQEFLSIQEDIKRLRHENAWSQKELAEQLGVSTSAVSGWERGKAEPRDEIREKLETLKNNRDKDKREFNIDYTWGGTGLLAVSVNGNKPDIMPKELLEQIAKTDRFLKHYSIDEIRSGLLDRKKAQMNQPVPKTYDAKGQEVVDVAVQSRAAKMR